MALRQDYRQCSFFCFADSITLFKKFIGKKRFPNKNGQYKGTAAVKK